MALFRNFTSCRFDTEGMLSRGTGSTRGWKTGAYKSHSSLVFLSSKQQGAS